MSDYGLWFIAMLGGALIGWGFRGLYEYPKKIKVAYMYQDARNELSRLKWMQRAWSKGDE